MTKSNEKEITRMVEVDGVMLNESELDRAQLFIESYLSRGKKDRLQWANVGKVLLTGRDHFDKDKKAYGTWAKGLFPELSASNKAYSIRLYEDFDLCELWAGTHRPNLHTPQHVFQGAQKFYKEIEQYGKDLRLAELQVESESLDELDSLDTFDGGVEIITEDTIKAKKEKSKVANLPSGGGVSIVEPVDIIEPVAVKQQVEKFMVHGGEIIRQQCDLDMVDRANLAKVCSSIMAMLEATSEIKEAV